MKRREENSNGAANDTEKLKGENEREKWRVKGLGEVRKCAVPAI